MLMESMYRNPQEFRFTDDLYQWLTSCCRKTQDLNTLISCYGIFYTGGREEISMASLNGSF